ncbi:MAG: sulfite exporter TauE/SafE family protein [Bacteroidetes bacterium]|nr:sulfite exporter TauE/SafE family protein [Bacteroidota bacterium]
MWSHRHGIAQSRPTHDFLVGFKNDVQCGRVTTYSIFGALVGLLGHSISINGWQSDISILSGIIIILFVLFNTQAVQTKINHRLYKFTTYFKKSLGAIMQKKSFASLYFIGILNGFLPCGFVYLALAGAASSHSVLEGMSYMALFGLGTIPMMLVISLSGSFISIKARNWVQKASPIVAIVLALFFDSAWGDVERESGCML